MAYLKYVNNLTQDAVDQLMTAIEIGRWDNGDKLTKEQLDNAMQAVIIWQANHKSSSQEPFKVNPQGDLNLGKGKHIQDIPIEFKE